MDPRTLVLWKYVCLFVILTSMLSYVFVLPVVYYVTIRTRSIPAERQKEQEVSCFALE